MTAQKTAARETSLTLNANLNTYYLKTFVAQRASIIWNALTLHDQNVNRTGEYITLERVYIR